MAGNWSARISILATRVASVVPSTTVEPMGPVAIEQMKTAMGIAQSAKPLGEDSGLQREFAAQDYGRMSAGMAPRSLP